MKTIRHSFLVSLLVFFGLVSLLGAASVPSVDVKVSNSGGKVVFKGKTDSSGNFATGKLAPGDYVVQFNGDIKSGSYALQLSVGKEHVGADSLPARKFGKGGVAMKVAVAEPTNLTGQLAPAGSLKAAAAPAPSKSTAGHKTKMINGHEYVWIPPEPGDWNGGKWVEADSIQARNAEANTRSKAAQASTPQPYRK